MRPYSPGGALNAYASTTKPSEIPSSSAHRLQRGLPGYLIPFAPHAFAPQRQKSARKPPSPSAFPHISTHFTATREVPLPPPILKLGRLEGNSELSSGLSPPTNRTAYAPSKPSDTEQRSRPLSYRGCWHRVSRRFLPRLCQVMQLFATPRFLTCDRSLQP